MPQTPNSSVEPFCTTTQALDYCDYRTLAQLFSDTNEPLSQSALIASTKFEACLMTATGMIESAAYKGERYTAADILLLTESEGASANLLIWITAKLAEGLALRRRPDKAYPMPEEWNAIVGPGGWLDQLASGERIFGFAETEEAGRMDHTVMTERDIQTRNGSVTQARRYWGQRAADWR